MLTRSMIDNSIALGVFALITAALLAGTYLATRDRIDVAERAMAQRALQEIIPQERHDNDLLLDTVAVPAHYLSTLGVAAGTEVHVARKNGQPVAVIVPSAAPDGYSGAIHLIIGINVDGTLAGVRVVDHKETPGLGDKIELKVSDWILSFDGRSLENPGPQGWGVRKEGGDFDQFTGATITPRAIVHQVRRTLQYFAEDRERLMQEADRLLQEAERSSQEAERLSQPPQNDSMAHLGESTL